MSLKDQHLQDATVVGTGGFKLDRRRAMEKLAKFQLEDPHRYVLELVSAAVCAGSSEIVIRNDADDLELTWDGDHPTDAELDELFDHIFYRGTEPRRRMLQHLAQGLYGALGLKPKWVRVQRPGLSLDFTDPMDVQRARNDREAGVFIHVRERFSWKVFLEAVRPFDDAYEAKLLRERASLAPIPILVNGADITTAPIEAPVDRPVRAPDGGRLWMAAPEEALDPRLGEGLLLLQDGVTVQTLAMSAGPLRLAGWVDVPALQLNASRSAVVADEAWKALQGRLVEVMAALVAEQLSLDAADEVAVAAALHLLRTSPRRHGLLGPHRLFVDALGRRWSINDLQAQETIWMVGDAALVLADVEPPLWLRPPHGEEGDIAWQALQAIFFGKMSDATEHLEALAAGRARRDALSRQEHPLEFGAGALAERAVERDGLRGVVAIPRDTEPRALTVELRVDGLPVERVTVQRSPLRFLARVESDQFVADTAFTKVLPGPARAVVERVLAEEAEALLLDALGWMSEQRPVRAAAITVLARRAQDAEVDLDPWIKSLPRPLVVAPLFRTLLGDRRALSELPGRTVPYVRARGLDALQAKIDALPPAAREELSLGEVLVLGLGEQKILRRALGRRLRSESTAIEARVGAVWRRATGDAQPRLTGRLPHSRHVADADAGLVGVIGLRDDDGRAPVAQVIRDRVSLGEVELPFDLPGAVASVSWDRAEPDDAWERLADPKQARELGALLRPHFARLVRKAAPRYRDKERRRRPAWLRAALSAPLDPSLLELPWFPTLSGEHTTLAALRAARRVEHFTGKVPRELPASLGEIVLVNKEDLSILQAHIPKRKLRSAQRRVKDVLVSHERYFKQEVVPDRLPRGQYLGRRALKRDGLKIELGVRIDGDPTAALHIRCLYERRVLEVLHDAYFLPVWAVVGGEPLAPNDKLTELADKPLRARLLRLIREQADEIVAELVASEDTPADIQLAVLSQLLRRQPVPGLDDRDRREAALQGLRRMALFPALGGLWLSLDEIAEAHRERALRVVSSGEAREPPPGELRWLKAGEAERRVLRAELGRRLPEGRAELEAWEKAAQRRSHLPRTPPVPGGRHLATQVIEAGPQVLWLGLSSVGKPALRLEWRIEGRIIETEELPSAVPLRARLSDPDLQPDREFRRPAPGAALNRARERVRQAAGDFMAALAEEVALNRDPKRTRRGDRPSVSSTAEVRWRVVEWGHAEKLRGERWASLKLVHTADGGAVTLPELQQIARRGPLRVVAPGTRGRTVESGRPALVCAPRQRRHLEVYGELEDFTEALTEEERIVARSTAPPVVLTPRGGDDVLLTRTLSGKREGFVQVLRAGNHSVGLHREWRALGRLSVPGPVPLVGEVSDSRLQPDREHRRAENDRSLRALKRDLGALSAELLPELLDVADVEQERRLLLRVLSRSFKRPRDVLAAQGALQRLAELPLFRTGSGEARSAMQLVESPHPPRFAPGGLSIDPAQPFICAAQDEMQWLLPVLGGAWEEDTALAESEILARGRATPLPHALPDGRYLARAEEEEIGGARILAGLLGGLPEPRLLLRSGGVPVAEEGWPRVAGLVAVIDVPAEQVYRGWDRVDLSRKQRRGVERIYASLLEAAAEQIRSSPALPLRIARLPREEPLRALPLLARVDGTRVSLDALAGAEHIILADAEIPEDYRSEPGLKLEAAPGVLAVLEQLGLRPKVALASRWVPEVRQRRAAAAAALAERERARAQAVLRRSLRHSARLLAHDLPGSRKLVDLAMKQELTRCPLYREALAAPDSGAGWVMAAWLLDACLAAEALQAQGPEIWARLSDHLGGINT